MPITNFPGGVSSFGIPQVAGNPLQYWNGGPVYWVGNRSGLPASDGSSPDRPLSSIFTATTGALAKVNGQVGATIFVLPGHVESITGSTNISTLIGGATATCCNIVGLGYGSMRPALNWTAAASALLCNVAGLAIRNFLFNLNATAATVVTAAITHSAADQTFDSIDMLPNTSATQLTTTAVTVASGADNLLYTNVRMFGETFATNPTDTFTTTAAVNKLTMSHCQFDVALNATTNGAINLANAPTNVDIEWCTFMNKKASSTVAAISSASTTGNVKDCTLNITNATGAATAWSTPGNLVLKEVYASVPGKAGLLVGTLSG